MGQAVAQLERLVAEGEMERIGMNVMNGLGVGETRRSGVFRVVGAVSGNAGKVLDGCARSWIDVEVKFKAIWILTSKGTVLVCVQFNAARGYTFGATCTSTRQRFCEFFLVGFDPISMDSPRASFAMCFAISLICPVSRALCFALSVRKKRRMLSCSLFAFVSLAK